MSVFPKISSKKLLIIFWNNCYNRFIIPTINFHTIIKSM
nr:MAG TPA: hypothetical protein [Caudoviricetes sp.]